jgi:hypothetical protein
MKCQLLLILELLGVPEVVAVVEQLHQQFPKCERLTITLLIDSLPFFKLLIMPRQRIDGFFVDDCPTTLWFNS